MTFADIIGTIGVSLILLAYFLAVIGRLNNKSHSFYLLNIAGAGLACYASVLISYWPFVVLEATWTLVSIYGLMRVAKSA
jgi:hypothetical protein